MATMYTRKGLAFLVDDSDVPMLSCFTWFASQSKNLTYILGVVNSKKVYLHRFIMGVTDRHVLVDHKNMNTLDFRRENLRIANKSQNTSNRGLQCNNKSGYKGVYWDKSREKFSAQIKVNNRTIPLGRFSTAQQAAAAYDEAAHENYREFARTNFQKAA